MKECTSCGRFYADGNNFCGHDGNKLTETVQGTGDLDEQKEHRRIPRPAHPLSMRLRIVDQGDDDRRSRVIPGLVRDVSGQGMLVQTGTVETGQLNIIRDHTIAFKNKLEVEVDLPNGTMAF